MAGRVPPGAPGAALTFAPGLYSLILKSRKPEAKAFNRWAHIRKGQRAWTAIKATAEEQRILWLEVGVALMYGKNPINRPIRGSDPAVVKRQKFSDWVQAMFSGLPDKTASDALWGATNSGSLPEIPPEMSHPEWIRKWANEQKATQGLPEDLQQVAPEPAPAGRRAGG